MNKPRIVVTSPIKFLPDQKLRLEKLGNITYYDALPSSPDEWMERTENAEIICSNKYVLTEKIYERKNVFYSLPFVAVQWIDKAKLKASNNTVSYNPGCNRFAVSEWILAMTLMLMRKFNRVVNAKTLIDKTGAVDYFGLAMKKACILGKGNIGSIVGKAYEALGVSVNYFSRGDNLFEKSNDCDIIVNSIMDPIFQTVE
jgi:phosphoglycerate dehydrogenase-like enzyme